MSPQQQTKPNRRPERSRSSVKRSPGRMQTDWKSSVSGSLCSPAGFEIARNVGTYRYNMSHLRDSDAYASHAIINSTAARCSVVAAAASVARMERQRNAGSFRLEQPGLRFAPSELSAYRDFNDLQCKTLQMCVLKTNANLGTCKTSYAPPFFSWPRMCPTALPRGRDEARAGTRLRSR